VRKSSFGTPDRLSSVPKRRVPLPLPAGLPRYPVDLQSPRRKRRANTHLLMDVSPGPRYNGANVRRGAQTKRLGDAWPVSLLLGGGRSPAALLQPVFATAPTRRGPSHPITLLRLQTGQAFRPRGRTASKHAVSPACVAFDEAAYRLSKAWGLVQVPRRRRGLTDAERKYAPAPRSALGVSREPHGSMPARVRPAGGRRQTTAGHRMARMIGGGEHRSEGRQ
jgi:hypothetical protein